MKMMKTSGLFLCLTGIAVLSSVNAWVPMLSPSRFSSSKLGGHLCPKRNPLTPGQTSPHHYGRMNSARFAKYQNMDEILALFPDDKPVLINFYDATTEEALKRDIMLAKTRLQDRCTVCSIKQQDYPELAKLWDAEEKSPSMILFRDGRPVLRFYEVTDAVDILTKVGQFC